MSSLRQKRLADNEVPVVKKPHVYPFAHLVSASKLRNSALQDHLVDYLNLYPPGSIPSTGTSALPVTSPAPSLFRHHILEEGLEFERVVISQLTAKIGAKNIVTICSGLPTAEDEARTKQAIRQRIPVIYQPLLINHTGQLAGSYGMVDLIIRADWLSKIFKTPNCDPSKHYVVVDVKNNNLDLCADGRLIRNSGSVPAFKCQLRVYLEALNSLQGTHQQTAFIMGRGFHTESKGQVETGDSPFDRLGVIDYEKWDADYTDKTREGIQWIQDLRRDGSTWTLYPQPSRPELYPNMTQLENGWGKFKKAYASYLGELTSLWQVGIRHRRQAHQAGVYSYRDPACQPAVLGITGEKTARVLQAILDINQTTTFSKPTDRLDIVERQPWLAELKEDGLEYYIDFETVTANGRTFIFMVGVMMKRPFSTKYQHRTFVLDELTLESEFDLLRQFSYYIHQMTDRYQRGSNPPLYHWGRAEKTWIDKALETYLDTFPDQEEEIIQMEFRWVDLCDKFRSAPIVIHGALDFGLKSIAIGLREAGLLKEDWDDGCGGGLDAMILAKNFYEGKGSPAEMKDIERYNKIDTYVMFKVCQILRKK